MLKEILKIIYETRVYSKSKIASSLNIQEDMVESLVLELLARSYIKEDLTSTSCGGMACSSCPMANCNKNPVKTYSLTNKGLKLVA